MALKTYKICVESVTSVISERIHKGLRVAVPIIGKGTGVKDEFVKDRDHGNRVGLRTFSAIMVLAFRVRHVILVVPRVKVSPIPARGEVDLRAKTVFAIALWKWTLLRFSSPEADV